MRATFSDMFSQSIPSRTVLHTNIATDPRMINNMFSFNMNFQINLLAECMVTISASIFKIADLYYFGIYNIIQLIEINTRL